MAEHQLTEKHRRSDSPILDISGLTKTFGGLLAVDDVDFQLRQGELRCLIGPNGAGKSTFFKLIIGSLTPDRGRILYKGEDITHLEPYARAQRGISIKFQTASIYPNLSIEDNLRIPAQRTYPHNSRAEKVSELIDLVNLTNRTGDFARDLSHGEQQWLEIAMTVAMSPDVLLLDEPTAGMTIQETNNTAELIKSLSGEGLTVIIIEHDINFVRQIAEWVTVMHNGEILTEGTTAEIEADEEVRRIYLGQS